ncbi:MAG: hypothetical protein DWQ37_22655 [Planctomycetota bacterium]|nr:MAG: hypothetical protein DWQ37_22655 [Planctomycetota bacterium]
MFLGPVGVIASGLLSLSAGDSPRLAMALITVGALPFVMTGMLNLVCYLAGAWKPGRPMGADWPQSGRSSDAPT